MILVCKAILFVADPERVWQVGYPHVWPGKPHIFPPASGTEGDPYRGIVVTERVAG
jgi:hypothetical protein